MEQLNMIKNSVVSFHSSDFKIKLMNFRLSFVPCKNFKLAQQKNLGIRRMARETHNMLHI